MSSSELSRFVTDIKNSESMQSEFHGLVNDRAAYVAKAKDKGYDITESDFDSASGELSDADLEKVSGGWSIGCDGNTVNPTAGC